MFRALFVAIVVLALAPAAQATIAYEKFGSVYSISDSGKGARKLAKGGSPAISPDGKRVVFVKGSGRLYTVSAKGGKVRALARTALAGSVVAWSPDGTAIALLDDDLHPQYVPLNGGPARKLATGIAGTMSFSPDGSAIVFDQVKSNSLLIHTIATATTGTSLPGALIGTSWTPLGIVTNRLQPTQVELVLMSPSGTVVRVLRSSPLGTSLSTTTYFAPWSRVGDVAIVVETDFALSTKRDDPANRHGTGSDLEQATKLSPRTGLDSLSSDGRRMLTVSIAGKLTTD